MCAHVAVLQNVGTGVDLFGRNQRRFLEQQLRNVSTKNDSMFPVFRVFPWE
jgi:hypothetical protein